MDTYRDDFKLPLSSDYKINITIISGKDKFLKYQQNQLGKIISEGGYFIHSTNYGLLYQVVVLLNQNTPKGKNPKAIQEMVSVIFHETSHMLLTFQIPSAPSWMQEGLAGYFEGFNMFGPNKRVYLDKARQSWCKYWAINGFPVELEKYLNMSQEEFRNLNNIEGVPSYTISYSLVYFMMSGSKTEQILKQILWDMKENARNGKTDSVQIINKNYPGGINNFERQWKAWIPTARDYRPLQAFRNYIEGNPTSKDFYDSNTVYVPIKIPDPN
jgi:hypothetical protein